MESWRDSLCFREHLTSKFMRPQICWLSNICGYEWKSALNRRMTQTLSFSLHYLRPSFCSMGWSRREMDLPVKWMVCNLRKMMESYKTDAVLYFKAPINKNPLMNTPWYQNSSFSLFPIRFLRKKNICMSSWVFILKRWKEKALSF